MEILDRWRAIWEHPDWGSTFLWNQYGTSMVAYQGQYGISKQMSLKWHFRVSLHCMRAPAVSTSIVDGTQKRRTTTVGQRNHEGSSMVCLHLGLYGRLGKTLTRKKVRPNLGTWTNSQEQSTWHLIHEERRDRNLSYLRRLQLPVPVPSGTRQHYFLIIWPWCIENLWRPNMQCSDFCPPSSYCQKVVGTPCFPTPHT